MLRPPHHASILEALRATARRAPASVALLAPGRKATSYDVLVDQLEAIVHYLRAGGIAPTDRVAVSLPNGPGSGSRGARHRRGRPRAHPSRPICRRPSSLNQFTTLGVRAVMVLRGHDTAARAAASSLGIPVIELDAGDTAGSFACSGLSPGDVRVRAMRSDTDAALLLFTSGTTGSPKLVPLTERNLLTSAANIAATLRLGPTDRCLNVMPLFHIHGLVAALLGSLVAGGSVVCTDGFPRARRSRVDRGVPADLVHRGPDDPPGDAAGGRARAPPRAALPATFRFVRSSSAALPVGVLEDLEAAFDVPVIEAYGMTEAAHQMTSNPLPDRVAQTRNRGHGRGSRGRRARRRRDRSFLPGAAGEVAIKGASVMSGYVDNPAANQASFVDGWFRTGDQGRFDEDGYLTITGRLKELINRGGEKVAPREIDDRVARAPRRRRGGGVRDPARPAGRGRRPPPSCSVTAPP